MPARFAVPVCRLAGLLGLAGAIALAPGCSSSSGGHSGAPTAASTLPATPSSATTVPATTVPASTTVPAGSPVTANSPSAPAYTPAIPQPSPGDAAAALVADWASGSQAAAGRVAAPAAVAVLFARPYPYGDIQSTGCTGPGTDPGSCTYSNRQNGERYEIAVSRYGTGWYVTSVTVES